MNFETRQQVLRQFVHRWTHENAKQTYGGKCPGCEQATRGGCIITGQKETLKKWTREEWHAYHTPLTTDADWLASHAFYVNKDGTLDSRRNHCEPAYMADLA